VCFDEWTKSLRQRGNFRIASVDQAQAVMEAERARPPRARNPVKAYQDIGRALKSSALPVPSLEPAAPTTNPASISEPKS
jgi:hypothetical protein